MQTASIFLVGYFGANNLGDELLLHTLIRELESIASFKFRILSDDPIGTKQVYPRAEGIYKYSWLEIVQAIISSNTVIFCGGSLLQDATSFNSLIFYSSIAFLAKLFGKELILLSQGIGPLNRPVSRFIGLLVLEMADVVTLREGNEIFQGTVGADLVWGMDIDLSDIPPPESPLIVVSLRQHSEVTEGRLEQLAYFINQVYHGYEVKLIALQPNDKRPLEMLSKLLGKQIKPIEIYDYQTWEEVGRPIFANAELVIGMRFHSIVLATKCGTPSIGISYDPKVSLLCSGLGIPCFELHELDRLLEKPFIFPSREELISLSERQSTLLFEINQPVLLSTVEIIE
ncbi:MAG: polysaccharide pyruvyl transferase CsaB [Candidatus Caenarcaniphilales bacterium]|nr:polysaccharide pyruvyl transferase CsaB [Candidatus Caenarcaniphilales bacterium]